MDIYSFAYSAKDVVCLGINVVLVNVAAGLVDLR